MPAKGTRCDDGTFSLTEIRTGFRRGFFVMTIMVNGKPMTGLEGLTIGDLLKRLDIKLDFTAVSLNGDVIRKHTYANTRLREHDRLEIVRPVGGG
ncbi:MAG TPA: sulfur carrier protein ThiS [Methylomirabilota bacterium]|nr:sulfur carrier protein ThiS [Methylomirabilota bacterium]